MAIMTTTAYNDMVNLIDLELQKSTAELPLEAVSSGLFIKKAKPNKTGDSIRFEEFEAEQYASKKGQGAPASKFKTQVGYSITVELQRTAENVEFTYEMENWDKYDTVRFAVSEAIKSHNRRLDLDLQHRIGFAFSTSYVDMDGETVDLTVGDGLALASTVHTLKASATTYRNTVPNHPQFSPGALEIAEKTWVENTYNHFGQKLGLKADTIGSTDDPSTCRAIMKELESTAYVEATNAGVVNPSKGMYRHIKFSRLATDANGATDTTKAKYWFLAATGINGFQAYYAINEAPHMMLLDQSNHYDVDTDIYKFPTRMGYAIGILSGKGIMISKGNGDA